MTREKLIKECDEMSQLADDTDFYASISRELKKAEKLEKFVDILKNKDIEMNILKATFKFDNATGLFYYRKIWCLQTFGTFDDKKFIEEEDYDLLKEMIK